jgi:hypothetical protein
MDAKTIYSKIKPLTLLVAGGPSSDIEKDIGRIEDIRKRSAWYELDDLKVAGLERNRFAPCYPVLGIHLADSFLRAGNLDKANEHSAQALDNLESLLDPQCRQNRAVATLYLGLVEHSKDRIHAAMELYRKASELFFVAQTEWARSGRSRSRVDECQVAAYRLEEFIASMELAAPSRSSPAALGKVLSPRTALSHRPLASESMPQTKLPTDIVVIAALDFALSLFGVAVAFVTGGIVALLVAGTIILALNVAALWLAYSSTGVGFWLEVPPDQTAVVDDRGQRFSVSPGQPRWLVPWQHRVRALVPRRELSMTAQRRNVPLRGADRSGDAHLDLTCDIIYSVSAPEPATRAYESSLHDRERPEFPATEEMLKPVWDSQIEADLISLLIDKDLDRAAARSSPDLHRIQSNWQSALARQTQTWGIDIRDLKIRDIQVQ